MKAFYDYGASWAFPVHLVRTLLKVRLVCVSLSLLTTLTEDVYAPADTVVSLEEAHTASGASIVVENGNRQSCKLLREAENPALAGKWSSVRIQRQALFRARSETLSRPGSSSQWPQVSCSTST